MYIKKIVINNFKIYNSKNIVTFKDDAAENITVICGDNGYGKTTLVTALVWCLYGAHMQEVDVIYKNSIMIAGGYKDYLDQSMNRPAILSGEKEFSVFLEFSNVQMPGIYCDSLEVERAYNVEKREEILDVRIDGSKNELVNYVGQEIFIQDFILPREIAKFFFFDSEKIVSISEIKTKEDRKLISEAYGEILGIKKYVNLRSRLHDLRIRFRKESANEQEREDFQTLGREISRLVKSTELKELRRQKCLQNKVELERSSDTIQEKLIREGSNLTPDDINSLRERKFKLREEERVLKTEFKELMEFAPLAMMGSLLKDIQKQLELEQNANSLYMDRSLLATEIERIVRKLQNDREFKKLRTIASVRTYYINRVNELLQRYFIEPTNLKVNCSIIHDFSREQITVFNAILSYLRSSYRDKLYSLSRALKLNKSDYANVTKELTNAEVKESDELIKKYIKEKGDLDNKIRNIELEIMDLSKSIGSLEKEITTKQSIYENLAKKIRVNEEYKEVDLLAERLIAVLDEFVISIKEQKKCTFENKISNYLITLMHKKDFIKKAKVSINNDIMDVHLLDSLDKEINKDDLSKGEKQLYATALLEALVKESGIEFPVFVDSPLQKLDDKHTNLMINRFFPKISKQVIMLPLLNKELNEKEYQKLIRNVSASYIINNESKDASKIIEVSPDKLYEEYDRLNNIRSHVQFN